MRPIIIEGPDASGKSTLARFLSEELGYTVKESEGPTRSLEDYRERLCRYYQMAWKTGGSVIFVRHPLISEPIYGHHVRRNNLVSFGEAETLLKMMTPKPIIIYCDNTPAPVDHQLKIFDTPEYLDALKVAEPAIREEYYNWVYIGLGAIYYQIGIDMRAIKCQVENLRDMLPM